MPLTSSDIEQFHTDGFCFAGRVLSDSQIEAMRVEELRFREARPYPANGTAFRSQLHNYSETVREAIQSPVMKELATQLIGPNACHWFNQFVTKMPDANAGKSTFPWHQDNGYVTIEPPTNFTIWIALDDVDTHNGCVYVLPQSHKKGLLEHRPAGTDNWHLTLDLDTDDNGVPAILKAGEAVAFTGLTLHRSLLNESDLPRRGFFIEYADPTGMVRRPTAGSDAPSRPITESPESWLVCGELPYPLEDAKPIV